MCGIAGLLNLRDEAIDARLLHRMTDALTHRGPEALAVWVRGLGVQGTAPVPPEHLNTRTPEHPARVGLGHTRLRIIDVTGGDQPIWNEDRTCLIVFNGEIYNFRELRAELEARGHRFATATDTEAILHAYEEWGEACPQHLRGMFAFAIWDEQREELFLARDRMGIKPLFLTWHGHTLAFASEMKSLLQDPHLDHAIDPAALDAYLALGYVPGPGTMLRAVSALPAGHTLTVGLRGPIPEPNRYWQVPVGVVRRRTEAECLEELDALLRDVVGRHLISDVPLGVFLSGGIDSSSLVAAAAAVSPAPLRTFSIGFPQDRNYDEAPFARQVAQRFGTEHREFMLEPDALEVLPALAWHLDQPLADPSAIPLYYLCQLTREHVTVALAGDGGDELFGGYERYYWDRAAARYAQLPRLLRRGMLEPLLSRLPPLPVDVRRDPFRRARKFVEHAGRTPASRYFHWFELMTPEAIDDLMTRCGDNLKEESGRPDSRSNPLRSGHQVIRSSGHQLFERAFENALARGASPLDTMQFCDTQTMLRDDLLHKCDRVSMAVALEARVPFLDHVLVEWAFSVPEELRVHGRTLKYLLKRWLSRYLPDELIHRRKQGFEVPVYDWLVGPGRRGVGGREWMRALLLAPGALGDGPFRREGVRRLVERLEAGERRLALPVYSLIAWELWRQQFLIRREPLVDGATATCR
jgi:asparagine synthase (glutamine-hydrolysing)